MSYISNLIHFVWSTAGREPVIKTEWEDRLYGYIGGVLENHRAVLLAAGGVTDHVHILASLPATTSLADIANAMKANSSRFVHDEIGIKNFAWQKGYAGFTVSVSMSETVRLYIQRQKEHHLTKTFQEELIELLEKHQIAYDPRYVFF